MSNSTHLVLLQMDFDSSVSYAHWAFFLSLVIYFYAGFKMQNTTKRKKTVLYIGQWSVWMPRVLQNAVYAFKASTLLDHGYKTFTEKAFQIIRNDGNITVLPHSLLEQLSSLPGTIASPHSALEQDLLGSHTGLDLILESRLHHSIVQRKLTPRLPLMTPRLEAELVAAIGRHFPDPAVKRSAEWTTFRPYQVLAKISAQISARALVGSELCRNDTWLNVSVDYTESLFRTVVVLRLFPAWINCFLRYLLPSYWNGVRYLRSAKDVLGPIIQDLVDKNDRGEWNSAEVDEPSVLHWLVDTAKGRDRNAETLAHVEVLLALASVHTTLLRMVNVLYDLTANSYYIKELRDEIQKAIDVEDGNWTYASYSRLEKLNSVMRESQRMSPPTILGLKRIFKQGFTFDDGTHISQGMYVTMPTYAIENDASTTPEPSVFDGLRHYRLRHMNDSNGTQSLKNSAKREQYQFSSSEPRALSFGYGKTACPGRYFAALVIKMVFVKLLTEYDFRFKGSEGRPQNIVMHEFLFCWPWHKMEMKKREHGICPF